LPGWIVGLKTRMITVFSSLGELAPQPTTLAKPGQQRSIPPLCSALRAG
jgi:hypothetical protein